VIWGLYTPKCWMILGLVLMDMDGNGELYELCPYEFREATLTCWEQGTKPWKTRF
jgi:hypothetical protein